MLNLSLLQTLLIGCFAESFTFLQELGQFLHQWPSRDHPVKNWICFQPPHWFSPAQATCLLPWTVCFLLWIPGSSVSVAILPSWPSVSNLQTAAPLCFLECSPVLAIPLELGPWEPSCLVCHVAGAAGLWQASSGSEGSSTWFNFLLSLSWNC